MQRPIVPLLYSTLVLLAGCEIQTGDAGPAKKKQIQVPRSQVSQVGKGAPVRRAPPKTEKHYFGDHQGTAFGGGGMTYGVGGSGMGGITPTGPAMAGFDETKALERISGEIAATLKFGKTLVVWLVEESDESGTLASSMRDQIGRVMRDLSATNAGQIQMAVVSFASGVNVLTTEPESDATKLQSALAGIKPSGDAKAATFAAFKQAMEKFLPYRMRGYEVIFVVAGASSGDDLTDADEVVAQLKRSAVPVFGIGPAVPFGTQAGSNTFNAFANNTAKPKDSGQRVFETLQPERLKLALTGGQGTSDLNDSGFGPFGLERVCRQTAGKFFRLRSGGYTGWDVDTATGDIKPELMAKYLPDYLSPDAFQKSLAENKAKQALVTAASLPAAVGLDPSSVQTDFYKDANEAAMANAITAAQRVAAEREQPIQKFYEALQAGEADRAKLTSPRWQAAFDLAMGQAMAAKARVDGYNAMLATLKQGKAFTNPNSSRWIIQPADEVAAGSALDKLAKNSRVYLKRVTDEHKGTPWAAVAERELRYPAGWKFVEQ